MEIPELNIISDFEAGMNCLQNPSLLSRFFSPSGVGKVPQVYSFCKWGALILALVATFSGLICRIRVLIVRFCKNKLLTSSGSPTQKLDDDDDYDFDDDESSSSASSDDEEYVPRKLYKDRQPVDEDFCVAGSTSYRDNLLREGRELRLRRKRSGGDRFSWSDFANGKSVVKLWDSIGLGLDFEEDSSENVVSVWDLNKDLKLCSYSGQKCQIPAVSMSSPAVILSAGSSNNDNVLLGLYDTRVGRQMPEIYAEWEQPRRKVVGINSGGVDKVYVRDGVTGAVTVGDMRNVKTPLEKLTEPKEETWWDADAVIVSDEFLDDSR